MSADTLVFEFEQLGIMPQTEDAVADRLALTNLACVWAMARGLPSVIPNR